MVFPSFKFAYQDPLNLLRNKHLKIIIKSTGELLFIALVGLRDFILYMILFMLKSYLYSRKMDSQIAHRLFLNEILKGVSAETLLDLPLWFVSEDFNTRIDYILQITKCPKMTVIQCTASTLCDQENHCPNINSSGRGSN